jgi:hypothetical protein
MTLSPRSALRVVAWLFILFGASAAASMIGGLFLEGRFNLAVDALGLVIGPGLLHYEARYRTWALRLLILEFVLTGIVALLFVFNPAHSGVRVFGRPAELLSRTVAIGNLIVLFLISVWQFLVLRRPAVRALFEAPDQASIHSSDVTTVA